MMITRIMLVMIMVRMLIGLDRNMDVNANIVNSDNNDNQIVIIIIMVIRMSTCLNSSMHLCLYAYMSICLYAHMLYL